MMLLSFLMDAAWIGLLGRLLLSGQAAGLGLWATTPKAAAEESDSAPALAAGASSPTVRAPGVFRGNPLRAPALPENELRWLYGDK